MLGWLRRFARRRVVLPALLMVLHVGTAVGLPVLHGASEALSSGRAFETNHSEHCTVVHFESHCAISHLHQQLAASARDVPIIRRDIQVVPPADRRTERSFRSVSVANGVRAPPLA